MTVLWINISTRWSLSNVQAVINVVVSVLSTVGIWAFSRVWWQRSVDKIIRKNSGVALSRLYTVTAPGDGWDLFTVLGRRLFHKESWHLLLQISIIVFITLASMLSGPIAAGSSRTSLTIRKDNIQVLQVIRPGGGATSDNLLEASVQWNETVEGLNQASFPYDQLLDFLPPPTVDWTYVASEWDPTWTMNCNFTDEITLENVYGEGNFTMYDPLNAFPVFRDTFDSKWLNMSQIRYSSNFISWTAGTAINAPFTDVFYFTLLESDPVIDDRWNSNNESMQLSISVLHAQNFSAGLEDYFNYGDVGLWRPTGPVTNASYTRFECDMTRKPIVANEFLIPWPWQNDTYSITLEYQSFFMFPFENYEDVNVTFPTPSAQDLFRFYQAYMITVGTTYDASPISREYSVWTDTVQLSTIFLAMVIISTVLILSLTLRFFLFTRRHNSDLEETHIPESKLEWMTHAARVAADTGNEIQEEELAEKGKSKDRDYLAKAIFSREVPDSDKADPGVRRPSLARVYTSKSSVSMAPPSDVKRNANGRVSQPSPLALIVDWSKGRTFNSNSAKEPIEQLADHEAPQKPEFGISFIDENSNPCSEDKVQHVQDKVTETTELRSSTDTVR